MYIDFKVTGWDRAKLDVTQSQAHQITEALKSGEITSSEGLMQLLEEMGIDAEWEYLVNTQGQLSPFENDGQSTIEAIMVDTKGKETRIYTNEESQWTHEKS